jgi:hypothetical protein
MAYDNRSVSPLKIKGSPYKKEDDKKRPPNKGETKDAYLKDTMSEKEYLAWKNNLKVKITLIWNGEKWVRPAKKENKEEKTSKEKAEFLKSIQMGRKVSKVAKGTEK